MDIKELVKKYSQDILNEKEPEKQEKALTNVIITLLDNLNNVVSKNNLKKKKDIKLEIEKTNNKYIEFVNEINKLAEKELLKPNGIEDMLKKQFKIFF